MEETECSETSEYEIQKPGNYPEESIEQLVIQRPQEYRQKTLNGNRL